MSTYARKIKQINQQETHALGQTKNETDDSQSKEEWVKFHAHHIFSLWLGWRTRLGISRQYMEQVKQELSMFYEDPLKKKFIEATY